jgi:hypothetical protein
MTLLITFLLALMAELPINHWRPSHTENAPEVSTGARVLEGLLYWHDRRGLGFVFPARSTLCEILQVDDRTLRRHLRALVEAGRISPSSRAVDGSLREGWSLHPTRTEMPAAAKNVRTVLSAADRTVRDSGQNCPPPPYEEGIIEEQDPAAVCSSVGGSDHGSTGSVIPSAWEALESARIEVEIETGATLPPVSPGAAGRDASADQRLAALVEEHGLERVCAVLTHAWKLVSAGGIPAAWVRRTLRGEGWAAHLDRWASAQNTSRRMELDEIAAAEREAQRAAAAEGEARFKAKLEAAGTMSESAPEGWEPFAWLIARTRVEQLAEDRNMTVTELLEGIGVSRLEELQPSDLPTMGIV